ncbi:type II toxin-antitoxin system toxin [soil metagenome]
MADEVVLNKTAVIERCLGRINEEYANVGNEFESDYTRQDSIVLNLLRASDAAIDLAMHATRLGKLGLPQESREAFTLLERAGWTEPELSRRMQDMVGFRNVAVRDYQRLRLDILKSIVEGHLNDFEAFANAILRRGAHSP